MTIDTDAPKPVYPVSALFLCCSATGSQDAEDFVRSHCIGDRAPLTYLYEMELQTDGCGNDCPPGCEEYRFIAFFKVPVSENEGFDEAQVVLDGLLGDAKEVINYEDETPR